MIKITISYLFLIAFTGIFAYMIIEDSDSLLELIFLFLLLFVILWADSTHYKTIARYEHERTQEFIIEEDKDNKEENYEHQERNN